MRIVKFMSVAAVLMLGASIAHADGLPDGRVGVSGGGGASGDCTSFQLTADGTGAISASAAPECKVTGVNATSITIAVPAVQAGGNPPGLQVYSPLLTNVTGNIPASLLDSLFGMTLGNQIENFLAQFNWTESCPSAPTTIGGVSAFECTLTAPAMPTDNISQFFLKLLTKANVINDGDCDANDFVFFIPVGCDVKFTTDAIGNLPGDTPDQLLAPNAQVDAVSNNGSNFIPFPEPNALSLLLVGFAGLPLLRRRLAR